MLKLKADRIEAKVIKMKQYEEFLEMVKDNNEEFNDLKEIVVRYDTLSGSNESLKKK
jgi:ASC-1-like (ASCH) protein